MKSHRVQLRRTKGWRMPPGTVGVARPTAWGNPYTIGLAHCGCRSAGECSHNIFRRETAAEAVDAYRELMQQRLAGKRADHWIAELAKLRGRNLACWCPINQPCHADVLIELANAEPTP